MRSSHEHLFEQIDLFGAGMREDPYPVYGDLRESDPVHWDESMQLWILTRYDDVAFALSKPQFSSHRIDRGRDRHPQKEFSSLFDTLGGRMSEFDEPDHKRLRSLVQHAFARAAVEEWQPFINERVAALLSPIREAGRCDLIEEFAIPLPLAVILQIVGIPPEDRQQVKLWCDDFSIVALNYLGNISDEELHRGLVSVSAFKDYLRERVESLRTSPRRDLLTSLVQAEDGGTRLNLEELLANALLLLSAGNETTTCVIGNGVTALLRNPEQLALLKSDPSLVPKAVEEILRYDSPVQFLSRIVAEDIELRGKKLRKGDIVFAVMGAANRDPEKYDDPDNFDITRHPNPHLAFGFGHHFCAGSQLARMESITALRGFLEQLTDFEIDPDIELRRQDNFNIRCFQSLPLKLRVP
ncbi:MAG: cytochrome P450 [Verrucomicrobiales bacterium]